MMRLYVRNWQLFGMLISGHQRVRKCPGDLLIFILEDLVDLRIHIWLVSDQYHFFIFRQAVPIFIIKPVHQPVFCPVGMCIKVKIKLAVFQKRPSYRCFAYRV